MILRRTSDGSLRKADTGGRLPELADPRGLAQVRMDARYPHYRDIPQAERLDWMAAEIRFVAFTLLQRRDFGPQAAIATAVALEPYVLEHPILADLTLPEMAKAFRDSAMGRYGEFYGLNAKSLLEGLHGYLETPEKAEAARLVRIARGIEKPRVVSPELIEKYAASMARAARERAEAERKEHKDNEKDDE